MKDNPSPFLGLGSNLGARLDNLRRALRQLDAAPGAKVRAVSPIYESAAHRRSGDPDLAAFLNMVARLETDRSPEEILDLCLSVESVAGRHREKGTWLPRTIDIDILAFGDRTLNSERLTIPHPRIAERRFVLLPFADLNPDFPIPAPFSATVEELLSDCPDQLAIARRYPAAAAFPVEVTSDVA